MRPVDVIANAAHEYSSTLPEFIGEEAVILPRHKILMLEGEVEMTKEINRSLRSENEALRAALAHAESMLSEHVEQYHDHEDPPHEPSERKKLIAIQHHIMGSLMDDVNQQIASDP